MILLTVVLIFGCSTETTGPLPSTNGPTAASISPAGGAITHVAENGTRITLDFPPGAVTVNTAFRVSALVPDSNEWAKFVVDPGVFLLEPVAITIQLPAQLGGATRPIMSLDQSVLFTDFNPITRELLATTHYLGYAGGSTDARTNTAGQLSAGELSCANVLQSLNDKLSSAQNGADNVEVLFKQMTEEFSVLSIDCPDQAPDIVTLETALQQLACEEYTSAVDDLQSGDPPATAQEVQAKVDRVVAAQGLKLEADADCGTTESFLNDITPVFNAYVQTKQDAYGDPQYVMELDTWDSLWKELKAVLQVAGQAGCFSLTDAVAVIESELMVPLMTLFRDKAYRMCYGVDGTHAFLADLRAAGALMDHPIGEKLPLFVPFDEDDLERDIQYCASTLEIGVFANGGFLLDSYQLQQDVLDYQVENEVVVTVPHDGYLELGGLIRALRCLLVSPYPDELLVLTNSNVAATITPTESGELIGGHTVNVADVLSQLGLAPGDSFTLLLQRSGVCDDFLGMEPSFTLFTIEVETECPGALIAGDGRVTQSCEAYASLTGHRGGASLGAFLELHDGTQLQTIDIDMEALHDSLATFNYTATMDTTLAHNGKSRSLEFDVVHHSAPTLTNGRLTSYTISTSVSGSAHTIGVSSDDEVSMVINLDGVIDFDVFGAGLPATIVLQMSNNSNATEGSSATVETFFDVEYTVDAVDISQPGSYEVVFRPGNGEAEIGYDTRIGFEANLGDDDEPGSAFLDVTITLTVTF